ncbi:MAG: leucyl aminopeptidase [Planctomyces sp.]|nr:leucyl aminopeptidase [Planctomyces sp.]
MTISFTADLPQDVVADWLLILVSSLGDPAQRFQDIDQQIAGMISGVMRRTDFEAGELEILPLYQTAGIRATNILLVGCGDAANLRKAGIRKSLLAGFRRITTKQKQTVAVCFDSEISSRISENVLTEIVADSVVAAPIDAGVCRKEQKHFALGDVVLCGFESGSSLSASANRGQTIAAAVNLAKELVNRPANEIYPETFCDRIAGLAGAAGIRCDIYDEPMLRRERMGAMLAVAQGSDRSARMLALHVRAGGDSVPTIALVGKGVTFDSGGYSLKPNDSMLTMKCDMAGAATCVAVGLAAAQLRIPVNLSVYVGLVENMVSGRAFKLGDVVTARNGTTIEIQNTDAEGRLVLADVLNFAVDSGASQIIDLATLTGACVVALGEDVAGLFCNTPDLANSLLNSADAEGEALWQLPLYRQYDELLKSDVADVRNIGGRWAGAITAARFLQKFVGDTPWAHLDIAGPAFATGSTSWRDSGATGCFVRSLLYWLEEKAAGNGREAQPG